MSDSNRRSSILAFGNDAEEDNLVDQLRQAAQEEGAAGGGAAEASGGASSNSASGDTSSADPDNKTSSNPFEALQAGHSANMATANRPVVSLSPYTGHPAGSQVNGVREDFTPESWCKRIEMVSASAGWSTKQTAFNAALALAPNSPAERWYNYASTGNALETWASFKAGLIKEFAPPATVLEKVNMFKSMKLGKGERAADFANKLHLKFEKFEDGLEHLWAAAGYSDEATDDDLKKRREKVVKDILNYLKTIMFAAGLPDALITEITKAKADNLEQMLEICRLSEAAQAATTQKPKTIASLNTEEGGAEGTSKEEIMQMIAAFMKADVKPGKQQKAQGKQRDLSKATCYYCFKTGHISPACPVKKEDREKGKFRLSTKDQPMSKEQWDALPKEKKTWRGRQDNSSQPQVTSASLQAAAWAPPPPPAVDWWGQFYQGNGQ